MYRNIILPVVLYGCGTWSLISMEERTQTMLENRVLRRIFGHKRDEVTRKWRKLHNVELNDMCYSCNIVRVAWVFLPFVHVVNSNLFRVFCC